MVRGQAGVSLVFYNNRVLAYCILYNTLTHISFKYSNLNLYKIKKSFKKLYILFACKSVIISVLDHCSDVILLK